MLTNFKPLVSVIIPTFNYGRYLSRAIESVLAQTYTNIEIIVVDDGSTDDTKEIVHKYNDPMISYIRHEHNYGLSIARNSGIKIAKGDYLAFLDSDDFWLPEKLHLQMEIFRDSPASLGLVYTAADVFDECTGKISKMPAPSYRGQVLSSLLFENRLGGGSSSVLIKRVCFDSVGVFDPSLMVYEDWDMWLRISEGGFLFDYLDKSLVTLTVHPFSLSKRQAVMAETRGVFLDKHLNLYLNHPEIYAMQHYMTGIMCYKSALMARGRIHFIKAIKYSKKNDISLKVRSFIQILASFATFKGYFAIKKWLGLE